MSATPIQLVADAVLSLSAEVTRLRAERNTAVALVKELGLHLTALCDHPENWENRYDLPAGKPCPGCYDARDRFAAFLDAQETA